MRHDLLVGSPVARTRSAPPNDAYAKRFSLCGSTTILIDGVDPFTEGHEAVGLLCRLYRTPDGYAGSPTLEQIAAVIDRWD